MRDGFYVNITYISDKLPRDGILELGSTEEMLDEVRKVESEDTFFRTDQDVTARRFGYYCCKKWNSGSYVTRKITWVAY